MKAIKFEGHNKIYGANQPQYNPLPAMLSNDIEGTVTTCWELSDEELEIVNRMRCVYLRQLTFRSALQPVLLFVTEEINPVDAVLVEREDAIKKIETLSKLVLHLVDAVKRNHSMLSYFADSEYLAGNPIYDLNMHILNTYDVANEAGSKSEAEK